MKPVIGISADMDNDIFKLRQDYVSAVTSSGGLPLIIAPVSDDVSRIAGIIDGLLLSGGDDLLPEYLREEISVPLERFKFVKKERTEFELALLMEILKRQKPVLAICYGMQLVNVALGGTIYQDIELQVNNAIDHRSGLHTVGIINSFDPALNLGSSEFTVNSFHHQAVRDLGDGMKPFAEAGDGIIEGIYKEDYPFLVGVQWHPERVLKHETSGRDRDGDLSRMILEAFIKRAGGLSGETVLH
ncbi:Glutamine amidotransferase, class I [hydrothermal vent metagenome]|uniref:Glutamine amidotransferase, class I n=1 Tax=hydrothermal vent metagenome TaxID=652676 RepID=A0A3B1D0T1_9ZZZZ